MESSRMLAASFWLVRHAPVAGPRGLIHGCSAPADTTDNAAIARLRLKLPSDTTSFASPSRRTVETARALQLNPILEESFREQDFGLWTGCRHDDLEKELGDVYRKFWQTPATSTPPQGESFAEQIGRVRNRMTTLPGEDAVLVVHSGTIRAALAVALNLSPDQALRFVIDPLSLTRIDRLEAGWRVNSVNQC